MESQKSILSMSSFPSLIQLPMVSSSETEQTATKDLKNCLAKRKSVQ